MKKFILFFLFPSLLAAEIEKMKSADSLTTQTKKNAFEAKLKSGFHFNDKAPNEIRVDGKSLKPSSLQPQKVSFNLPKGWSAAQASLYVCDDAVTVCEIHKVDLSPGGTKGKVTPPPSTRTAMSKTLKQGFYEDNWEEALRLAKEKKQLLFVEFGARWCPGCIRYEKEIFGTREFQKATQDMVKLKIDVDRFENFDQSEKFSIKGIPTVIIFNSDQKEVDRLVDFYPMERLNLFLKSVKDEPTPMADLMAQKSSKDPALKLKIGQRLLASGQAAASLDFLGQISPAPPELLWARFIWAQDRYEKDKNSKEDYKAELQRSITAEPRSSRSLIWRSELLKLQEPSSAESQKTFSEGVAVANELLSDPEKLKTAISTDYVGEFTGYERLLIGLYKADLVEASQQPEEAMNAWKECADIGKAYKISPERSGPALRYLIVLNAAKRYEEANQWSKKMLAKDPHNFDLQRRRVHILLALNQHKEAARLAEKIIPGAVGRNQFWVAESLAKAYIGLKQTSSAKKLITAYLSRPEIQTEKMQSSRKNLEDLLKTL